MLLALKKTQSGQAGKHSSLLSAWGVSLSPQPLLPAGCEPLCPPGSSATLGFSRPLHLTPPLPHALCLPQWLFSLSQLPGSLLVPREHFDLCSPLKCCGSSLPPTHHSTKGAADQQAPPSQVRKALGTSCPHSHPKAPSPIWGPEQVWPSPTLSRWPSPWVWQCLTLCPSPAAQQGPLPSSSCQVRGPKLLPAPCPGPHKARQTLRAPPPQAGIRTLDRKRDGPLESVSGTLPLAASSWQLKAPNRVAVESQLGGLSQATFPLWASVSSSVKQSYA